MAKDRPGNNGNCKVNGKYNSLFYGDNLETLRKRIKDETVDLCYIDPPFNSKRNYNQIYNNIGDDHAQEQAFIDTWTWDDHAREGLEEIITNAGGRLAPETIELIKGLRNVLDEGGLLAYLISMTRRIVEIHRVLKPTGSFYLHCDPTSSHYLKLILDSIFCSAGGDFKSEIAWKRSSAHSDTKQGRKQHGRVHDIIFFYTKSDEWTWKPLYIPYDAEYVNAFYKHIEPKTGRRYQLGDLSGPGGAAKGNPQYELFGIVRYWRFSKDKMQQLVKEGRVIQPKPGAVPRYKRYLDEMPGVPLQDVWTDIGPVGAQAQERLGYPTQKPEALMERIIGASSNEGDLILDAYCGCGTTIAVAQRLNRRWIGMDITYQSIALVLKRLEETFSNHVAASVRLDGIPKDVASAEALAHKKDDRLRKEFEKWAVLTYSRNRAAINYKKGADAGIDGTAYFLKSKDDTDKMVFQVKSGHVGRGDIAKLKGDMQREKAAIGTLITLKETTRVMRAEAKKAGFYVHELTGRSFDRVQIVTIKEILENKRRIDLPLSIDAIKSAKAVGDDAEQGELEFQD